MRVLITSTSTFFTPPLIQGFASRGIEVTAADSRWFSVGKAARHVLRRVRLPVLACDPFGYLQALAQELRTRSYDLVLPAYEESLLLAEYRHLLEPFTRLLLPSFETMWQVHDKRNLYKLCQELRIPAPPTIVPRSRIELEQQIADLRFPVVVKLPTANNCVGRSYCENTVELIERFNRQFEEETRRGAAPPFIQQKIEGEPVYTLMLCQEGRKLGEVIYRPLRTYPERGGTSAHRESIEHPLISALTERISRSTRWTGFLGTDFIVDRADGTAYLIDANPRLTPAVHLGCLAGVDWAGILVRMVEDHASVPVTARPGVRTRSILLDLGWLLEGCHPQKNWRSRVRERVAKYRQPDWSLDVRYELAAKGEWLSAVALTYQGIAAAVTALMTGRGINETLLDDVNYDPVAVERLRRSPQGCALLAPADEHPDAALPLLVRT